MPRAPRKPSDPTTLTATMHLHQVAPGGATADPGLVLLYADDPAAFPPAYVFRAPDITVGRVPEADLCIRADAVSRSHARIRKEGDRWVLTDLGGHNGTIVNGRFVSEVELADRDEVRFGDAIFKFVAREAAGYAHYRIDGAIVDPATGHARPGIGAGRIVGGFQMQRIAMELRRVAKSGISMLLLGESGTGKEVFAEQAHDWSGRSGPFQTINCAAIPTSLIEGELFGHYRGSHATAHADRVGLIRAAHGGTLFLDEIGDMPLEAQTKLLRVLQSKEVTPLGGKKPERVDVRIICATHRDLGQMQKEGLFRADLFARMNEYSVTLPPLRHRKEDLLSLCIGLAARHGRPDVQVTLPFMAGLIHHDFPYNVRELEALIKRWAAVAEGSTLDVDAFSEVIRQRMVTYGSREAPPPTAAEQDPAADAASKEGLRRGAAPTEPQLRALLAQHRGNLAAVGRQLGRDRAQVHRWMVRYGIPVRDYR